MNVNDEDARNNLLIYVNEKFPDADRVRLLREAFSTEIIAVELKIHGGKVLAGISRPLWEHSADFAALRAHMEKHRWFETVNSAPPPNFRVLLGDNGWVDWVDWE